MRHLYVVGSVARGDARADSDVDLVIEVDPTSDFSLITLGSVTADVEEWLDRNVDIGEAIKALATDLLGRHPAVDWRGFARFRDVLAHQDFRIEPTFLWKAVSASLPPLEAALAAELGRSGTTPDENDR